MRALALVVLLASGCTLLHDWDSLHDGVPAADSDAATAEPEDAASTLDATPDVATDARSVPLGCGGTTCAASEICCVSFEGSAVKGTCAPRGTDAAAACAGLATTGRLAGILECDTSAQCAGGSTCCGNGKARLDNATVYHATCVSSPTCDGSGLELCGPGRESPGDPSACHNGADHCERTRDLDPVDDASETPEQFPLLKCAE